MTETAIARKNPVGLTFGFIGGLALVVYNFILYKSGVEVYGGSWGYGNYLIAGFMAVWGAIRVRNQQEGAISLGEGFRVIFAVFALSFLLLTLFNFFLFNYIDVPFRDVYSRFVAEKGTIMFKKLDAPAEYIEEYRKSVLDPDGYKLNSLLVAFATLCMIFFPVSLIIALIIRRKRSPLENSFK